MADDTMERMAEYIRLGQQGDREKARRGLDRLWERSAGAQPVIRCGLAHSLADVQDDPIEEMAWDLAALTCAVGATDADADELGMNHGVAGLMPSLYLNLADVCRRLGQLDAAREYGLQARAALDNVEDDPYFEMITAAVDRVMSELDRQNAD